MITVRGKCSYASLSIESTPLLDFDVEAEESSLTLAAKRARVRVTTGDVYLTSRAEAGEVDFAAEAGELYFTVPVGFTSLKVRASLDYLVLSSYDPSEPQIEADLRGSFGEIYLTAARFGAVLIEGEVGELTEGYGEIESLVVNGRQL